VISKNRTIPLSRGVGHVQSFLGSRHIGARFDSLAGR
jgi:hypothetical protein